MVKIRHDIGSLCYILVYVIVFSKAVPRCQNLSGWHAVYLTFKLVRSPSRLARTFKLPKWPRRSSVFWVGLILNGQNTCRVVFLQYKARIQLWCLTEN